MWFAFLSLNSGTRWTPADDFGRLSLSGSVIRMTLGQLRVAFVQTVRSSAWNLHYKKIWRWKIGLGLWMLQLSQPLPPNDLCHRAEGGKDCCQQGSHVRRAVVGGVWKESSLWQGWEANATSVLLQRLPISIHFWIWERNGVSKGDNYKYTPENLEEGQRTILIQSLK